VSGTTSATRSPVRRIDDTAFAVDAVLMKTVVDVYESVPWYVI
jgi:hypothetical protein